jgi:hypothetical protein
MKHELKRIVDDAKAQKAAMGADARDDYDLILADPDAADRLRCPRCDCPESRVYKTRHAAGRVIRQRECRHCGKRFRTVEVMPSEIKGKS